MIDPSMKQAMKEARRHRLQQDKTRVAAQHAWRKPAKEAKKAERRALVDAAISERRAFELKYADVGFIGHVSPVKIKRQIPKPKSQTQARKNADRRYRRKNQSAINAKQRQRYAVRRANKRKIEESTT